MSVGDFLTENIQDSGFTFLMEESHDSKVEVVRRLPLFSRCPITNEARLEDPRDYYESRLQRTPLNSISNVPLSSNGSRFGSISYNWSSANNLNNSSIREQEVLSRMKNSRSAVHKPSLDEVKDTSVVALTNKFGKGKYWFKSASPTPDPRWSADQQLMIGPIPGDVEYSQLRAAFLAQGHTLHLFIQNNQGWLEKNHEKFGAKHVKFGYVVYTEKDTARRLLCAGFVPVGPVKIRVKEMDGQPAIFS